jgi:hypothetical protein
MYSTESSSHWTFLLALPGEKTVAMRVRLGCPLGEPGTSLVLFLGTLQGHTAVILGPEIYQTRQEMRAIERYRSEPQKKLQLILS